MAFTGSWNTAVDEGDRACKHERDEDEQDKPVLYRLMFSHPRWNYLDGDGGCVVRFQRLDALTKRWVTIDSGVGNDELSACRELRAARRAVRS